MDIFSKPVAVGYSLFQFIVLAILGASFSLSASADRIKLLVDDREAMQARADIIKAAQTDLYVEYYTISDDDISLGFIELLLQAAARGVKVKLMVDSFTSHAPYSSLAAMIEMSQRRAGPEASGRWHSNFEIKVFNPFKGINLFGITHRTHAKIVLADQSELITGGRNIGDDYFGTTMKFADTDIYVSGAQANRVANNFLATWNSRISDYPALGNQDPDAIKETCEQRAGDDVCNAWNRKRILDKFNANVAQFELRIKNLLTDGLGMGVDLANSNPAWLRKSSDYVTHAIIDQPRNFLTANNQSKGIGNEYSEQLLKAESTLTIVSPYMVPTDEEFAAMKILLARKVKIKLITNSILASDDMRAVAAYYQSKNKIISLGAGLEIYEFDGPRTLHAKIAIIDGKTGVVGTFNIDPRSFNLNRELAIAFSDTSNGGLIQQLNDVVGQFQSKSLLVGQDGAAMNIDAQSRRAVPDSRAKAVKRYLKVMPFIRSQI